jgi:hypothetical protein
MNQDLNLSRLLRAVDRRILVLIVVGLLGTFLLQNMLINPAEERIRTTSAESAQLQEETTALETRVQEILSGGTQTIDDVTSRVLLLERTVPVKVDDLVLTAELFQLAGDAVILDTVQESEETPPAATTGLSYVVYDLTGSGSLGSLGQYLQEIALTGTHIITVDQLKVTVGNDRSNRNEQGPRNSVDTTPTINFEARLRVWYDTKDRLLNKPAAAAPSGTAGDSSVAPLTRNNAGPGTAQVQPGQQGGTQNGGQQPGSGTTQGTGAQQGDGNQQGGIQQGSTQQNPRSGNDLAPGQQVLPGQPTN